MMSASPKKKFLTLILMFTFLFSPILEELIASISLGQEAPDFTLMSIFDEQITLSDYRGKAVLLDFWATWCGPCEKEIPELSKLNSKYGEIGLVIISINLRENKSAVKSYAEKKGMNWITVIDPDGKVAEKYGVTAIPTLVLVDKHGVIASIYIGLTPESILASKIESILSYSSMKLQSSLYIKTSHNSADVGDNIIIEGTLRPNLSVEVILEISKDGLNWEIIGKVIAINGSYSFVWQPNEYGRFWIRSRWEGNPKYHGTVSSSIIVEVRNTMLSWLVIITPILFFVGLLIIVAKRMIKSF